jgi:hypothetical protein
MNLKQRHDQAQFRTDGDRWLPVPQFVCAGGNIGYQHWLIPILSSAGL